MNKVLTIAVILVTILSCNIEETSNISQLNIDEFKKDLLNGNLQLIDVRTPEEFSQGYIPNAKSINYFSSSFKTELNMLDKEKPVYLYCKSGKRSSKASKICNELGFKKIYNLTGGYLAWSKVND